jgi:enamine deaminase RidA (YjgF/YER057c/UK114 family)
MKPTRLLDTATTPDGTPLTLHEHDGTLSIRVGGVELMSTRQHHSEERLAELACAAVAARRRARVLVGGLGMGFTLRRCLACLAADAEVVVAELVPAVVRWNRDPAYGLAADALADPRVTVHEGDVAAQAEYTYGNIIKVLKAAGAGPEHLVKTIEYVTPAALARYREVAAVREKLLPQPFPASTGLVCEALLRPEMQIEIDPFAILD